jgi:hypothetical protein
MVLAMTCLPHAHAQVSKERNPVLLHDCEEHIEDGLSQLSRELAAGQNGNIERGQDERAGAGDGGKMRDVTKYLKMRIERAKIFQLPMRCIISNFKELGPLLKEIVDA